MTTASFDQPFSHYPDDALQGVDGLDTISSNEATTLDELFRERVRRGSDAVAYTQFDDTQDLWQSFTWAEMAAQVERYQVAMKQAGLLKGDRVAIGLANSIEWIVFDQAALRLGLVVVPLYVSDRADNMAYVIQDSGAKLLLVQNPQVWADINAADEDTRCVQQVVVLSGSEQGELQSELQVQLVESWLPEFGEHMERGMAQPDDLASIVYTSGTTGRPKGVMLSHKNMLSNAYTGMRSVALTPQDRLLSFLPLSHTLERTVGYYAALMSGCEVVFNRSIKQLSDDLAIVKPTVIISVPRIFERAHNAIHTALTEESAFKRMLFELTIKSGWQRFLQQQGDASWQAISLLAPLLQKVVGSSVLQRLGGNLRFAIVGGAPLSVDVAKTFIGLGLPLLQGYGLTETSPIVSVNTLERNRPDSIGMLLRGASVVLAENEELLIRSDSVMQGYWNNQEATDETIVDNDGDRWLRSGDRASIDEQGFLRIIGRIKDILVLANGEKVPPADIEAAIARDPMFEQSLVLGEGKSFLSALVVLDNKLFEKFCLDNSLLKSELASGEFVNSDLHQALIKKIAAQMEDFPGYAKIRKVSICAEPWTVESGLLTPTLKVKRPKVEAHYQQAIDEMYAGHGVHKS